MKTKNLKFFFALVLITFASFLSANAEEKKK